MPSDRLLTAEMLSSLVLLNNKWWQMDLQLDWHVAVVCEVEESKEMFSLLEMW